MRDKLNHISLPESDRLPRLQVIAMAFRRQINWVTAGYAAMLGYWVICGSIYFMLGGFRECLLSSLMGTSKNHLSREFVIRLGLMRE